MLSKAIRRQCVAMLPVYMMMLMGGIGASWVTSILSELKSPNSKLTLISSECSWIASLEYCSRSGGSFLSAFLLDRIGRTGAIRVSLWITFLGWIILCVSKSVFIIYISRILYGLSQGVILPSHVIYITENSFPHIRGYLVSVASLSFYGGQMVGFVMVPSFSYTTVNLIFAALTLVSLVSSLLLKETPQYLLIRGEHDKAESNFTWLSAAGLDEQTTRTHFKEIVKNVVEEKAMKRSYKEVLRSPHVIRGIRIVFIFSFLLSAAGTSPVNTFRGTMLRDTQYFTADVQLVTIGILQLLTCGLSSVAIDRFNRRLLLLLLLTSTGVLFAAIIWLYSIEDFENTYFFAWCIFIAVAGLSCVTCAILPLFSCIRGEVLAQSIKSLGLPVGVVAYSITGFLAVWAFLPISHMYGIEANFVLYLIVNVVLGVYMYWDLPETRGMTLVHIENEMKQDGCIIEEKGEEVVALVSTNPEPI